MTTLAKLSSNTRGSDESGPNFLGHVGSHQENLQNKDVSKRLQKLLQFDVLCDKLHGKCPTYGPVPYSQKNNMILRLQKLLHFNDLCDKNHGIYPTHGQLIMA